MTNNIQLGEKYFFVRVGEYNLSDGTFKVEGRIYEVTIKAMYSEIDKPTTYAFDILAGHHTCKATDLYKTEAEAVIAAKDVVSRIEVLVLENKIEEPEEMDKATADTIKAVLPKQK